MLFELRVAPSKCEIRAMWNVRLVLVQSSFTIPDSAMNQQSRAGTLLLEAKRLIERVGCCAIGGWDVKQCNDSKSLE